ncbi:unnamed protein product, partial [Laminaria digitata]
MVCLGLGVASRSLEVAHVVVRDDTPRHVWLRRKQHAFRYRHRKSRVPTSASSLTLELLLSSVSEGSKWGHELRELRGLIAGGVRRQRYSRKHGNIDSTAWWPESLRRITFVSCYDIASNYPVPGLGVVFVVSGRRVYI